MHSLSRIGNVRLPVVVVVPLVVVMLAAGVFGGRWYAVNQESACPETADTCANFAKFWRAWDIASANFVDPAAVSPDKMTDGAIEGMLDSLGDEGHTRYLSAQSAQAEQESLSGRFEGIGAYVSERDGQILLQPIDGSPAEKAGIRTGDVVVRVNGETVEGLNSSDLAAKVRGPKGSNVTLTIQHQGDELPVDLTITRDEITTPSTTWRMLPNKVALVRLTQFSEPSSAEFKQALVDAQQQGATSIVLDLRNNPGGLVNQLVSIAGQFLPVDSTVLIQQERDGTRTPTKTTEQGVATTIPMVVLVNNFSASSAEILAGSLQENGRAKVVGVPTYGTATVLNLYDLGGGAQMRLGTTQWLTPKGEVIRGKGITPDEVVALPTDVLPLSPQDAATLDENALLTGQDKQLARALELLASTAAK